MSGRGATWSRTRTVVRKYRTQCKRCGGHLYMDEPAVWLTDPLGLSHEECPS